MSCCTTSRSVSSSCSLRWHSTTLMYIQAAVALQSTSRFEEWGPEERKAGFEELLKGGVWSKGHVFTVNDYVAELEERNWQLHPATENHHGNRMPGSSSNRAPRSLPQALPFSQSIPPTSSPSSEPALESSITENHIRAIREEDLYIYGEITFRNTGHKAIRYSYLQANKEINGVLEPFRQPRLRSY